MKGMLKAGGIALVVAVLFGVDHSRSEPQKKPVPHTRIGLVNMGYVLKNYEKVDLYTKEMKAQFAEFDQRLKELKSQIDQLTKKSQDKELSDEERQELQEQIKKLEREAQDSNDKMKKILSEKTDQQMVAVYTDIHKACERYAKAHDLELVLHYIDAVKEEDFANPMNVMGKMQQRSAMPIYMAPGIEISVEIAADLNKRLQEATVPLDDAE